MDFMYVAGLKSKSLPPSSQPAANVQILTQPYKLILNHL